MIIFLSYTDDAGKEHHERFFAHAKMWEWLQEFRDRTGKNPSGMLVYEAKCIFDGT